MPQLEEQAEAVGHTPVLDHPPVGEPGDVDDRDLEGPTGRWPTYAAS